MFISHLHSDHVLDLVTLLQASNATPGWKREDPLELYGCRGLATLVSQVMAAFDGTTPEGFPLRIIELGEERHDLGGFTVETALTAHTETSLAFRIEADGQTVVYSGDAIETPRSRDSRGGPTPSSANAPSRAAGGRPTMSPPMAPAAWPSRPAPDGWSCSHLYPPAQQADVAGQARAEYEGEVILAVDGTVVGLGGTVTVSPRGRRPARRWLATGLALAPFFLFGLAFEVVPVLVLLRSSLLVDGVLESRQLPPGPHAVHGRVVPEQPSALAHHRAPRRDRWERSSPTRSSPTRSRPSGDALTALADVTTNFGGAPLAFAFIVTLGSTGVVTLLLKAIGVELYPTFRIYSESGLTDRLPLLPAAADDPADRAGAARASGPTWREAATSLGATPAQFWLRVGLPILAPSLLGSFLLLFANAFGAYATAWTLTGPDVESRHGADRRPGARRGAARPRARRCPRPPLARRDGRVRGRLAVAVATRPAVGAREPAGVCGAPSSSRPSGSSC